MASAEVQVHLQGKDDLWDGVQVARLVGREAISEPFTFELTVIAPPSSRFGADAALAAEVDLVFEHGGQERRRVHGLIAQVDELLASSKGHRTLKLLLRPRVERLALVETQEVFLDVSVPELVGRLLERCGFVAGVDFRFSLGGSYAKREIVVQYAESILAFVSRLTEHLGISFFFEHVESDGGVVDRIVFTDREGDFPLKAHGTTARFRVDGERVEITELTRRTRLVPSFWAVQDQNDRTPTVDLTAVVEIGDGDGGGVVEDAPHAVTPDEARHLVRVRSEERLAQSRFHLGAGHVPELGAGTRFDLTDHPLLAEDARLLVVEIDHELEQVTGAFGEAGKTQYRNRFRAVASGTTYRPPRRTPRPRIHGVVAAVVAPLASGVPGAIAQLDDEGRYRVRFHFDGSPPDAMAMPSHPIRQAQHHAGPGYGTHFPLKPETEVLVAFLGGDPDRPVIVGAVPNAITPSPIAARDVGKHRIQTAAGVVIEMGERAVAR